MRLIERCDEFPLHGRRQFQSRRRSCGVGRPLLEEDQLEWAGCVLKPR